MTHVNPCIESVWVEIPSPPNNFIFGTFYCTSDQDDEDDLEMEKETRETAKKDSK